MAEEKGNKPVAHVRVNSLSASIWATQLEDGNTVYNVTLQRSYKDKEDNWQNTPSFRGRDTGDLALLALKTNLKMDELNNA